MKPCLLFLLVCLMLDFGVNGQTPVDRAKELADTVNSVIQRFQKAVEDGIYVPLNNEVSFNGTLVNLPGNTNISAGFITLPVDFLCNQPDDGLLRTVTCHLCTYDCTYVHNKYGGQCGYAANPLPGTPQTSGKVCVCNENKLPNVTDFTDVVTQCGSLVEPISDAAFDFALARALRLRMFGLQCPKKLFGGIPVPDNNVGCISDCTRNHDYVNGTCMYATPVATQPLDTYPGFNCVCSH